MNDDLHLTHFPVDDLPLLVALLRKLDVPGLYDRAIKDHGLHTGLSGGWLLTIWLVFILTEGDHTKYKVQDWVARHAALLSHLCERPIHDQEFNDNRLSRVLARLAVVRRWEQLEAALWQHSLTVYQILQPSVGGLYSAHCDATTVSGYHQVQEDGLMQRGVSKAHRPDLAQLKLMTVALHPHGQWIGTQVAPGHRADDGLYLPLITRVREVLGQTGVLYVGDAKMAALATRAQLQQAGDYYLTVAPATGATAQQLPQWIEAALAAPQTLTTLTKADGSTPGRGYERQVERTAEVPTGPDGATTTVTWQERLLVVQTNDLQTAQTKSLQDRVRRAEAELRALTPPPKQGRKQYADEASLQTAISAVLAKHQVAGLLGVRWEVQEQTVTRQVGRGRPGAQRPQRIEVKRRYQITAVERHEAALAAVQERLGWRVYLTNAPATLSLATCVQHYRENWRSERQYHRLKSAPSGIAPRYVRRDEQLRGLTPLLTLGVRLCGWLEIQVAAGLQQEGKQLTGLYPGLPQKATAQPTAVALLQAVARARVTLTCLQWQGQQVLHLSPLPDWLPDVLRYLHLSPTLYAELPNNSIFANSISRK
jgi:transposase